MSVIIKGVDKPKECSLCFLRDAYTHYCPYEATKEKDCPIVQVLTDEFISRQATIDLFKEWQPRLATNVLEFGDALQNLPSAQPEQKKGKWIPHEDEDGEHYGDKCSECGEWYVMPYGKTNFCPNCGANMRGEQDG